MKTHHCDSCDPSFSCWSNPAHCRKIAAVSLEESRAVYQAGYRHQRRGGFCIDVPYPLGSWQYQAWLQGYDHAAYKERNGLTHLHLHLP
jgi:hypothetical protein